MSEFVFPITATLLVYLVAVPLLTVVARAMLEWHEKRWPHPHEAGDGVTFAALLAPVAIPTIGMGAAALHRLDGHHAMEACIALHQFAEGCPEALLLLLFVGLPIVMTAAYRLRPTAKRGRRLPISDELGVPVHLVDGASICVRGLFRPWIELGPDVQRELTPEQLRSALLHEVVHARSFDPLLMSMLLAANALNPAWNLLERWFERWRLGREIRCDLEALTRGADRFELATSLLSVARIGVATPRGASALTGAAKSIRLRVAILVGGEQPAVPSERTTWVAHGIFLVALAVTCAVCELRLLDALHHFSERAFYALM